MVSNPVAPVGDEKPSGKARGMRLVKDTDPIVAPEPPQAQIPVDGTPAGRTEVVSDVRAMQWAEVARFLGDKQTKGNISCLKAEEMIGNLIRGGKILSDKATEDNLDHGFSEFISLKRARILCYVAKKLGTNKTRPIFMTIKLTDRNLLWAMRDRPGSPNPIGNWKKASAEQIPHLIITVNANWVRELPDDKAREGWIFDNLKLINWDGVESADQPFSLVGHEIVVNEDTIALYGAAINDTLLANRGMRSHTKQLGFPEEAMNPQETYTKLQAWLSNLGALLFREEDGAILDGAGNVLYHVSPEQIEPPADEDDRPEIPPDDSDLDDEDDEDEEDYTE